MAARACESFTDSSDIPKTWTSLYCKKIKKNRIKGRDWYDFEWYVRNRIALDFNHLQVRAKDFNGIDLDKEQFTELLKKRLAETDIASVKADVLPYDINKHELDIWSNDYFLQLADMIVYH